MSLTKPNTIKEFVQSYKSVEEAIADIQETEDFAKEKMLVQNVDSPFYQTMLDCMAIVKQLLN